MRKIYLATSWRNPYYPDILQKLMAAGHEVYDFRDPRYAFKWGEIDANWQDWTPDQFRRIVATDSRAKRGFDRDKEALDWCDTCVMLQPCGASAHLEAGYAIGQKKPTIIYLKPDRFEPELMYRFVSGNMVVDDEGLLKALERLDGHP